MSLSVPLLSNNSFDEGSLFSPTPSCRNPKKSIISQEEMESHQAFSECHSHYIINQRKDHEFREKVGGCVRINKLLESYMKHISFSRYEGSTKKLVFVNNSYQFTILQSDEDDIHEILNQRRTICHEIKEGIETVEIRLNTIANLSNRKKREFQVGIGENLKTLEKEILLVKKVDQPAFQRLKDLHTSVNQKFEQACQAGRCRRFTDWAWSLLRK